MSANSHQDGASLLAIDVGEIHTRAVLFDVVEGRYRFLAFGSAPTTAAAPYHHIGEGIRKALDQLEEITGRKLVGIDERLVMPERQDGSGVDTFVATMSAGPPLKVLGVGLLEDVSLESVKQLATTISARVVETLSLNDRRKPEGRLDTILATRPDIIIIAGGTEEGATYSVLRLVEAVGLACSMFPKEQRPDVLYAGNSKLADEVKTKLKAVTNLYISPNLQPDLDIEQIAPARTRIADIYRSVRGRQILGVKELDSWTGKRLTPTPTAFGRIIQFLSKVYDPTKGVLGVDVGASTTTIAAAFAGNLTLGVFPQFGLGRGLPELLKSISVSQIARWLPVEVSENYLTDYIYNKSIHPGSIPVTPEDLAIELALARQVIRSGLALTSTNFPKSTRRSGESQWSMFEPILAAGSVLTHAPTPGHSLLTLLDSLQPVGVTTMVLDQSNLTAPLGAVARLNPVLVVQVLESSAFLSLATVISPAANARPGTPILRLRVTYESGDETSFEIKQGTLEALPLPMGQSARLRLQPLHRADIGMGGPGRGGSVRVVGGVLGVVIDARGRPLRLPEEAGRRRDLYKKWLWTLGGG
jgi:hypothetical protein